MHLTKFRKSEKWKNKKLKFVNENCIYCSIYYFSKQLICLLHTYSLSRQLKHHQLRIRRENFISIEIILNVFNALPKSLFWLWDNFCLFQLASSGNFLYCQICKSYCPLRKKRRTLLPEGTDVHIWQHIHQKD